MKLTAVFSLKHGPACYNNRHHPFIHLWHVLQLAFSRSTWYVSELPAKVTTPNCGTLLADHTFHY